MATRLYIDFKDNETDLEKFLGVTPGSVRTLFFLNLETEPEFISYLDQVEKDLGYRDVDYAKYSWMHQQYPDLAKISRYNVYGLGRITPAVYAYIDSIGMDPVVGRTSDPEKIGAILHCQRVKVPENIKEIYWS